MNRPDAWLKVAVAAEELGETPRGIYALLDRGCPHSRIGRRIRVRLADITAFYEQNMVGGSR